MKRGIKKLKEFWFPLLIIIFFAVGLFLRLYLATGRAIWADEVFYFGVAKESSILDILLLKHWIKDNPPLFILFLKTWSLVTNSVVWLRIPSLIIYSISFFLLYRLLEGIGKITRVFILFSFSVSAYFVFINSWISPYNFIFLFSLIQLNLISDFLKRKLQGLKFILLFTLMNFLLINSHYSALYIFLSYPFILLYIFFYKKNLSGSFLLSLILSFLAIFPTITLLSSNWEEFSAFQQQDMDEVSLNSLLETFSYALNNSFLRLEARTKLVSLFFLGVIAMGFLRKKAKVPKFTVLMFLSFVIPSTIFVYLFQKHFPTILGDRTLWPFHLGVYFGLVIYLEIIKKTDKFFYWFSLLVLGIVFTSGVIEELRPAKLKFLPSQVSLDQHLKKDYDLFINNLISKSSDKNTQLILYGDDYANGHQRFIFLKYYWVYDKRLSPLKPKGYIEANNFNEILQKTSPEKKVFVVNFDWKIKGDYFEGLLKEKKYDPEVYDFWEEVKGKYRQNPEPSTGQTFFWSGSRELNPGQTHPMRLFYR